MLEFKGLGKILLELLQCEFSVNSKSFANSSGMMAKLNSSGIQSVGGLAIITYNMEFDWNLCQIENGYQMLLEMIPMYK